MARLLTIATVLAAPAIADADVYLSTTAYSPCSAGSRMADGTHVRFGSVASNMLPLGQKITLRPGFAGHRRFTVRDRIGYGTQLDVWLPSCGDAIRYGRRAQRLRLGWPRRHRLVSRVIRSRAYAGRGW